MVGEDADPPVGSRAQGEGRRVGILPTARSLWNFIMGKHLKDHEKVLVMDILLAGEVCNAIQKMLASRLDDLPRTVPVEKAEDRMTIAMCARITQDRSPIDELSRSVRSASRSQLGACFVDPERLLEGYRRETSLLALAEEIIASYQFTGEVRRLTIPKGCSDIEAAEALSQYAMHYSQGGLL